QNADFHCFSGCFNGGNFHKISYTPNIPFFLDYLAVLMGGNSHKIRYLPKVTSSGKQMLSRRQAPDRLN
ncbi:MAG: hypothetical protein IKF90_07240, partial [Parasporobacterium sp.]|nr:hypothetical protein [Parasporobacterium sp.]